MKKLLAILLTLAMIFSFAACGKTEEPAAAAPAEAEAAAPAEAEAPALTYDDYFAMDIEELKPYIQTVASGKLTVATSPDFAPYEFYSVDANGNYSLAGFDPALAGYIADYLGLELDVIPMDFDGPLVELAAKNVDLSMAGYSPDPDRMDKMDFSDIYYMGGQSFCVSKANENLFASLEATNDSKYKVSAQVGSIQIDLAEENSPNADIIQLTKVTEIIAELLNGTIDGAYIETAVAETYAKNYPDLVVKFDVPYDQAGSAVGVSKDNLPLLAGVNQAVAAALADGSMNSFVAEANELASGETFEGLLQ